MELIANFRYRWLQTLKPSGISLHVPSGSVFLLVGLNLRQALPLVPKMAASRTNLATPVEGERLFPSSSRLPAEVPGLALIG